MEDALPALKISIGGLGFYLGLNTDQSQQKSHPTTSAVNMKKGKEGKNDKLVDGAANIK